jgi:hypothetical protein
VTLSDAAAGGGYKTGTGYLEVYGDYGEIAVTSAGDTFAAWREGFSWTVPAARGTRAAGKSPVGRQARNSAPNLVLSASTMRSRSAAASSSVRVRSCDWKVTCMAMDFRPSPTWPPR